MPRTEELHIKVSMCILHSAIRQSTLPAREHAEIFVFQRTDSVGAVLSTAPSCRSAPETNERSIKIFCTSPARVSLHSGKRPAGIGETVCLVASVQLRDSQVSNASIMQCIATSCPWPVCNRSEKGGPRHVNVGTRIGKLNRQGCHCLTEIGQTQVRVAHSGGWLCP
jgi:hypothetical protein